MAYTHQERVFSKRKEVLSVNGERRRTILNTFALGVLVSPFVSIIPSDFANLSEEQLMEKTMGKWFGRAEYCFESMLNDFLFKTPSGRPAISDYHKDDDPERNTTTLMGISEVFSVFNSHMLMTGDPSLMNESFEILSSYWRDLPFNYAQGFNTDFNPDSDPNGIHLVAGQRYNDDGGVVDEQEARALIIYAGLMREFVSSGNMNHILTHLERTRKKKGYTQSENANLQMAIKSFEFSMSNWDPKTGGIDWQQKLPHENSYGPVAGSNGPVAEAALRLYQITKDNKYIKDFHKIYYWMQDNLSGHVASPNFPYPNLYFDTLWQAQDAKQVDWKKRNGVIPVEIFYPHDIGSMMSAEVLAFQVSRDPRFLIHAVKTLKETIQYFGNSIMKDIKSHNSFFNYIPEYNRVCFSAMLDVVNATNDPNIISSSLRSEVHNIVQNYASSIWNNKNIHIYNLYDHSFLFDIAEPGLAPIKNHSRRIGSTAAFIDILYELAAKRTQIKDIV